MARKSTPKASAKASFSSSRRGGFTAVDLGVSTLAALSVGFALFAMPSDLFSSVVLMSGLPNLVAAAQPPLGATARLAAAGAGAIGAFVAVALILRWLGRAASPAPRVHDVETLAPDAPRVRRADAHPDAPPRRPIFAGRDFGEEEPGPLTMEPLAETVAFEAVDEEPRLAPPAPAAPPAPIQAAPRAGVPFPPSDEPFYDPFRDLYRRPAAPEPPVQAAPTVEAPAAPPPVADWPMPTPAAAAPPPPEPRPEPVAGPAPVAVQPPFAPRPEPVAASAPVAVQPPPPAPRPEPALPAPAAPKAADSIAELLGRLDQGLARRGAAPPVPGAAAPQDPGPAPANRLREALGDLQRIAGRG